MEPRCRCCGAAGGVAAWHAGPSDGLGGRQQRRATPTAGVSPCCRCCLRDVARLLRAPRFGCCARCTLSVQVSRDEVAEMILGGGLTPELQVGRRLVQAGMGVQGTRQARVPAGCCLPCAGPGACEVGEPMGV